MSDLFPPGFNKDLENLPLFTIGDNVPLCAQNTSPEFACPSCGIEIKDFENEYYGFDSHGVEDNFPESKKTTFSLCRNCGEVYEVVWRISRIIPFVERDGAMFFDKEEEENAKIQQTNASIPRHRMRLLRQRDRGGR